MMKSLTILLLTVVIARAQECDPNTQKCDQHERCPVWRDEGECYRARTYMIKECPVSCKPLYAEPIPRVNPQKNNCQNTHEKCPEWAANGECKDNYVSSYCSLACGKCDTPKPEKQKAHVSSNPKRHRVTLGDDKDNDPMCQDMHKLCSFWAQEGECDANPNYMHTNCAKSCHKCTPKKDSTHQNTKTNEGISEESDSTIDPDSHATLTEASVQFGVKQTAQGTKADETLQRLASTLKYMSSEGVLSLPDDIQKECKNRHEMCTFWQVLGECDNNKSYMQTQCAAACHTCHLIDHATRCPKLDIEPALVPGRLNEMFKRIVETAPGNKTLTEEELASFKESQTPIYSVVIHSQPTEDGSIPEAERSIDQSLPPWVFTFEDLITPQECDELVQLGYKYQYKRSEDVGARKFDGSFDSVKSAGRTSENAWCSDREGCRNETVVTAVQNRMANILGIPPVNSEDLQLLKYEEGQFYRTHHDYIPHQKDRQCGPRILTFFLYLSDVEAGGGTDFPKLNITVMPKKGRALLWPSVLNSSPLMPDNRMKHQALPVEAGTKFAANAWYHTYDYLGPQQRGCN